MGGCASSSGVTIPGRQSSGSERGFYKAYKLGHKLGEGAFGQVRVAKSTQSQGTCAVKIIDMTRRASNGKSLGGGIYIDHELLKLAEEEIAVWKQAGNAANIVELYETFVDGSLCFMVMEKCRCSLMEKVEFHASEVVLSDVFKQMLRGISHVHKNGVVHRDIKPENFLFDDNDTLKLCDFGLAAALPKKCTLNGCFGTAPYMSPEMVKFQAYDTRTDVWSFAACAYLLTFGNFPYRPETMNVKCMKDAIKKDSPKIEFCKDKGDPLFPGSRFAETLLNRAVCERLSADAALELEFLKPQSAKTRFLSESFDAAPALRRANTLTKKTQEFLQPINPIVQKSLDNLMAQLRKENKLGSQGDRFFSEGMHEELSYTKSEPADDRILIRNSIRKSTHSGIVSLGIHSAESSTTEGSAPEGSVGSSTSSGKDDLRRYSKTSNETEMSQSLHI